MTLIAMCGLPCGVMVALGTQYWIGKHAPGRPPYFPIWSLSMVGACSLAVATVMTQGASLEAAWRYAAELILLALAIIDLYTLLLPNLLTLPLLGAGLAFQNTFHPEALPSAIIAVLVGYGVTWCFAASYRWLNGHDGLGLGDVKLFAALGAWTGWQSLPLLMTMAALGGICCALLVQFMVPQSRGKPFPFGPWLAFAGWLELLAGNEIMICYQAVIVEMFPFLHNA
uniref:prepilin peptidase n=1 Tax=Halomonas sp. TaxID=1486246 RepID=UPI00262FC9A7|nr:A24 family peptidase [Halomonas sp.]